MKVLGIDPGYAIVGIGIVESDGNRLKPVAFSAILTDAGTEFTDRLKLIYNGVNDFINQYNPDCISIEKLYFQNNVTTAMKVAEARGVILLAAGNNNIPVYEYTPLQVKSAVVGYGKAVKGQIMEMTRILLGLKERPKPDDTADALALAICHIHTNASKLSKLK